MTKIHIYICMILVMLFLPIGTRAAYAPTKSATLTPLQRAEIQAIRQQRPLRKVPAKPQSWLSKLWSTIGSGVLGSLGVVAGSAIAWYTLRKKSKTFTSYYDQIKEAQQRYSDGLISGTMDKAKLKANFKKQLILIQEEAELTAAQKKLDSEQLTAIINKIQRMIEETRSS